MSYAAFGSSRQVAAVFRPTTTGKVDGTAASLIIDLLRTKLSEKSKPTSAQSQKYADCMWAANKQKSTDLFDAPQCEDPASVASVEARKRALVITVNSAWHGDVMNELKKLNYTHGRPTAVAMINGLIESLTGTLGIPSETLRGYSAWANDMTAAGVSMTEPTAGKVSKTSLLAKPQTSSTSSQTQAQQQATSPSQQTIKELPPTQTTQDLPAQTAQNLFGPQFVDKTVGEYTIRTLAPLYQPLILSCVAGWDTINGAPADGSEELSAAEKKKTSAPGSLVNWVTSKTAAGLAIVIDVPVAGSDKAIDAFCVHVSPVGSSKPASDPVLLATRNVAKASEMTSKSPTAFVLNEPSSGWVVPEPGQEDGKKGKDNTMLYVIGGVGVLAVLGVAVYAGMKKK